jgi:hypothetical protein
MPTFQITGRRDEDGAELTIDEAEMDTFFLAPAEQRKKSAIWDRMHNTFLEAREKKKKEKEEEAKDRETRRSQNRQQSERQSHRSGSRKKREAAAAVAAAAAGHDGGEFEPPKRSRKINVMAMNAASNPLSSS